MKPRWSKMKRKLSFQLMGLDWMQNGPKINKKLRAMMRGEAHIETDEGKHYSMTNFQVLRYWGFIPVALELRVRRLLFFQEIVIAMLLGLYIILVFYFGSFLFYCRARQFPH